MVKATKVVHGVVLEERCCGMCTVTFWVQRSHPQAYCSELCMQDAGKKKKVGFTSRKNKRKSKKLKHVIKESDYET